MNRLPLEPFDPAALIRRVKRRRPIGEVAALFGIDPRSLGRCITQLRQPAPDGDPAYPVRRRKLRGVVYLEPTDLLSPPSPHHDECRACGEWVPGSEFVRAPFGRWDVCAFCRESNSTRSTI